MKIIAVMIEKGGAGKTTTAAALGHILARDHRVLMIDADQQGNLSTLYGVDDPEDKGLAALLASVHGEVSVKDVVKRSPGIPADVIPANGYLMDANTEIATDTENDQVRRLQTALAAPEVVAAYDYVIVDCGLLKLLVSRGYNEFAVATCNIRPKRSQEEETVDLIAANSQRVKSITDQLQEYTTLKNTLEAMRANGQKLEGFDLESGRLRDVIAAILHKSTTKIAQIERIAGHLIPELKQLLDTSNLKFSAAYQLAGLDESEQLAAYDRAMEDGQEITNKAATQARRAATPAPKEDVNPWASSACQVTNGPCQHYGVIKANFLRDGQLNGCAGCCKFCKSRSTCDFRCEVADREVQMQAAKKQPKPEPVTEASPKTVTSICFSCANWDTCMDRNDKTTSCDMYRNKNTRPEPQPAPVTKYQAERDAAVEATVESQDDAIDLIRWCIANAGLEEIQTRACLDMLDALVAVWSMEGMK